MRLCLNPEAISPEDRLLLATAQLPHGPQDDVLVRDFIQTGLDWPRLLEAASSGFKPGSTTSLLLQYSKAFGPV